MPSITVKQFGGVMPRVDPALLPEGGAQRAYNCVLKSGVPVPLRQPRRIVAGSGMRISLEGGLDSLGRAKTLYLRHRPDGDTMLAWPGVVWVAESNLASDPNARLFAAGFRTGGDAPDPPVVYVAEGSLTRVAPMHKEPMPAPVARRSLGPLDPVPDDARYTFWRQTWVDRFGYESPPSPPSGEVVYQDGDSVSFDGLAAPAGAVSRRLYKAVAGLSEATDEWRFVFEQPAGDGWFVGTAAAVRDEDAGEAMPDSESMPADLLGLVRVPGGFYAGWCASNPREVRFSEPDLPGSWPLADSVSVHDDIVGLGVTLNTVFVVTRGKPWAVTGTDPAAMSASVLASPQGCPAPRSICVEEGCVFYVSEDGIVMLRDGAASASLVTRAHFSRREWQALGPAGSFMVSHDNRLHLWPGGTSGDPLWIVDLADSSSAAVTTCDEKASAAFSDPVTDTLYFVRDESAAAQGA